MRMYEGRDDNFIFVQTGKSILLRGAAKMSLIFHMNMYLVEQN